MKKLGRTFGSTRTAAWLLAAFALSIVAERVWPALGDVASRTCGALVAGSLVAALALHPRARRGALGAFHAGLLLLAAVALVGHWLRFEGRVEVATGTDYDPAAVVVTRRGPLHDSDSANVAFRQGPFTVRYAPGLRRGRTESYVQLPGGDATVGDDRPLVIDGYRFYTTHNKGFAPVLEWSAPGQPAVIGAVHMPSYPLFDWKQSNAWTAPDGRNVRLWLDVAVPRNDAADWTLRSDDCRCALVVESASGRTTLRAGESADLGDGVRLRLVEVRGWMGYRIFRDPTLAWLLALAFASVAALGWHFVTSLRPRSHEREARAADPIGAAVSGEGAP